MATRSFAMARSARDGKGRAAQWGVKIYRPNRSTLRIIAKTGLNRPFLSGDRVRVLDLSMPPPTGTFGQC